MGPATRAGARLRLHRKGEPAGLLGIGVGGVVGERDAGLGQALEQPPGDCPLGANLQHPQGPVGRPRLADLAQARANDVEPGGADRGCVQQMLDHRQRRRFGLTQTIDKKAGQFLGDRRNQRELGNQLRSFGEQQAPNFGEFRKIILADQPPAILGFGRRAEPDQQLKHIIEQRGRIGCDRPGCD